MFTLNRRGVIGFMLTMAVGIALGAAALVVSNEIVRNDKDKQPFAAARGPSSPANVEKAFEQYQKAYRDYQQAAGLGRPDMAKYAEALREAKRNLEIEIFRNTPGVSEMDMQAFEEARNASAAAVPTAPVFSDAPSPFGETAVAIGAQGSLSSPGSTAASTQTPAQSQSAVAASSASSDGITGMDYYRVKSGDSLYNICEKYYGNGGMWQHIIKYQASSIAATPNLIFPGQLIALPRGLATSTATSSTTSTSQSSNTSSSTSTSSTTSTDTAPFNGNESWQENFQQDYLISDHALTNSGSMSVAQIQKFLESKNSVLAKPYRGSTPAQMIYNAARKYGINPQVLLTRLQCEQGLISKSSATQHKLDWALGVGCYDSGNWNQKFKGLDKQIEYAAHTYRRHYDDAKAKLDRGEKVVMTIDGKKVQVKSAATYSFYKYCPHFQGNKLFYDVWRGYRSRF
ncbi:MAG: hypothetical protein CVV42_10780 [Candidatus Riflebacteria bacterium HGW-Riflebacteria-2]|nr:MAG: hypothetical protein CVV42_10780 [Candidatus Riflebacteria bacterium HGW-Riflebacteria-2]